MGLEEVVMSDGERYLPPSTIFPLSADITVAAPGGLDTGTEEVSTWYEIYLIGKSSTASTADLRMMFHKAKTYTALSSFTTATDANRALRRATGTATDKLAQGIQFSALGTLTFVDVAIQRAGSVSGTFWFTLQTSTGSDASGTVLSTTFKVDAAAVSTTAAIIRIPFTTNPTVSPSTQYHLVMEGDYARSDTVNIIWYGVAAGGYASGAGREYNGGAWANASGVGDFFFRVFLTRNETALTFPVGYDQSCKLGYVYNNSAGNFVSFLAHDREVRRLTSSAGVNDWGAGGATVPTLVDISALIPPSPVIMKQVGQVSVTGVAVIAGGVPDGFGTLTQLGDYGSTFVNAPVANYAFDMPDLYTHFQGAYTSVSATATGHIYLIGWRWLK
jgi:hypothetical protein